MEDTMQDDDAAPQYLDEPETNAEDAMFEDYAGDEYGSSDKITIYCRSRKTLKKGAGGAVTLGAGAGAFIGIVGTGGLAAPLYAAGVAAGGATTFAVGSCATGYMVNPRVMRIDFASAKEANEAYEKIGTYKIMIRNNVVTQQDGKSRWIAELIGSAVTDTSESGPGIVLETPQRTFNILRSPMTLGGTKTRMKMWAKFNIKQYVTDSQETADAKWKKLGRGSNAVYLAGNEIEKKYGRASFVNELIGWYVLGRKFGGDDKNQVIIEDLDNVGDE